MFTVFFKRIFIGFFIVALAFSAKAQNSRPFWNDIKAFKKADSLHRPEKGEILFVGSSSFTYWTDVQKYFSQKSIINRGFGGSSLIHLIDYADDIIFPYNPRQIVIYCGENDIADGASSELVFDRFKSLIQLIRKHMGKEIDIVYISIKPSPSRVQFLSTIKTANFQIKDYISKSKNIHYVDVFSLMINKEGEVIESLFKEDRLHMKPQGYQIWAKAIAPYLTAEKK